MNWRRSVSESVHLAFGGEKLNRPGRFRTVRNRLTVLTVREDGSSGRFPRWFAGSSRQHIRPSSSSQIRLGRSRLPIRDGAAVAAVGTVGRRAGLRSTTHTVAWTAQAWLTGRTNPVDASPMPMDRPQCVLIVFRRHSAIVT